MAKLRLLGKRLNKIVRAIAHNNSRLLQKGGNVILKELVITTPVDESTAESNWRVGLGRPELTAIRAFVSGKRGSTATQSANRAIRVGKAKIELKKIEQPLFITNTLDYIKDLNAGISPQAAPGFVERAVDKGIAAIRLKK